MNWEVIDEDKLETIVGGEYISASSIAALMSILAILIAVYKMYTSTKGKAKIGNDYTFEWS